MASNITYHYRVKDSKYWRYPIAEFLSKTLRILTFLSQIGLVYNSEEKSDCQEIIGCKYLSDKQKYQNTQLINSNINLIDQWSFFYQQTQIKIAITKQESKKPSWFDKIFL